MVQMLPMKLKRYTPPRPRTPGSNGRPGYGNRTHITQIFVQDTFDGAQVKEPLSSKYWESVDKEKKKAERQTRIEMLARPRSTPTTAKGQHVQALTEAQRAVRRAQYSGKVSETLRPGTASSCSSRVPVNRIGGSLKTDMDEGIEIRRPKKSSTRCNSAPATTYGNRPSSAFHTRCFQTCNLGQRVYARQPFISNEDEAKSLIRQKVKQHKEVLVAVLDCSVVVPELFQRSLLTQAEVKKILSNQTNQDQNRKMLSLLVLKSVTDAFEILDVIRNRQLIFKDVLEVPGLQRFVDRCGSQAAGKEVTRALKHLKSDPNAITKRCPICTPDQQQQGRAKRRSHSAKVVSQMGRDFSNMSNTQENKMPLPPSMPLTAQEKRRLIENLETISEVSTTFEERDNLEWYKVLQAEPDIIRCIYSET